MALINRIIKIFYWVIIISLFVVLVFSAVELILLMYRTMMNNLAVFDFSTQRVNTNELFLNHVQRFIAGILLLTIIIELIQSFLIFLKSEVHSKYLVVLYEIAMIAIVRHLFTIDLEHIHGLELIGISVLVLVLGALNFLNKPSIIKKLTYLNKQNQDNPPTNKS